MGAPTSPQSGTGRASLCRALLPYSQRTVSERGPGRGARSGPARRVATASDTATDPLAVLVEIAANVDAEPTLRVQAAAHACPYLYPRLSAAVVAQVPASQQHESAALVDRIMGKLARFVPVTIEGEPARDMALAPVDSAEGVVA